MPKSVNLERSRALISKRVRFLRLQRGWTLKELAEQLELSVSRLSEIERGSGSFSAEQFLLLLRLFNVPASEFTDVDVDPTSQLQATLTKLGARHLRENADARPIDSLEKYSVIQEALIEGSPRVITSLAPILVENISELSPLRLATDARVAGYENRLGWVVESTLVALNELQDRVPRDPRLAEATVRIGMLTAFLRGRRDAWNRYTDEASEDLVDRTIRSQRTLEQVKERSSKLAREWRVITTIRPEDFANALVAARKS